MIKKRYRRRLKKRAARWKAHKESTYESALTRRLFGYDIIRGSHPGRPAVGILT